MKKKANPKATAVSPVEGAFDEIVELIRAARQRAYQAVNTELVSLYWQIGKYISGKLAAAEWGEGVVDHLAKHLARTLPGLRGFTRRNLIVLGQSKSPAEREFYLRTAIQELWSKRELERQFRLAAFERAVLHPPKLSPTVRIDQAAAASVLTVREPDSVMDEEAAEEDAPLTEAQRLEAERRLLEYEAHPERYSTWEEVKRRLESRRRLGL